MRGEGTTQDSHGYHHKPGILVVLEVTFMQRFLRQHGTQQELGKKGYEVYTVLFTL